MTQRIKAFREHYPWIDTSGLAYFEKRCVQAPREASYALDVVVEHCVTPAQQAAAAQALTLKCDVLWSMLDAIDYAYREPVSA
jgi:pyrroloquinoline-quinone synthase